MLIKNKQKFDLRDRATVKRLLADAYLGIHIDPTTIFNPLRTIPEQFSETPHLYVQWLMSQPEYFQFIVKEIMNIELHPFQCVILKEMWNRKLPFLIGSRGMSKTFLLSLYTMLRLLLLPGRKVVVCGAAFRQSKIVFDYMRTFYNNAPILADIIDSFGSESKPSRDVDMCTFRIGESIATMLPIGCLSGNTLITTDRGIRRLDEFNDADYPKLVSSNGQMRETGFFFDNGEYQTYKITTKRGYQYIGTPNHKMKVLRNNKIVWCRTDELTTEDNILINRKHEWFEPSFKCSSDEAYALGCMIGDGNWTNKYFLHFTTKDLEFIDSLSVIGKFKTYDDLHYYYLGKKQRQKWLDFWGLTKTYTKDKVLPNTLLSSNKENVAACLSGLFDTDGSIQVTTTNGGTQCQISFYNTSKYLIEQIQYLLLHFGIICTVTSRQRNSLRTSNLCMVGYELHISGENVDLFHKHIGFRLSRKQKQLDFYIQNKKHHYSINSNLIPINKNVLLDIAKRYNFGASQIKHTKNVTQKALVKFIKRCRSLNIKDEVLDNLELLASPDIYFDNISKIEDNGICHTYDLNIPENNEYIANGFFSHNTGEKIRGQRAHDIITDEINSINQEVLEKVIFGFAAVSATPMVNVKDRAAMDVAKIIGYNLASKSDDYHKSNQIIMSGTCGYTFQHMYTYWRKWRNIIMSKGDPDRINEIFRGEIPLGFDWRDYSIMRIPFELLPRGFMDEGIVAQAQSAIGSSQFNMEYKAVFAGDSAGFYKRTLIESCVANHMNNISHKSEQSIIYHPMLKGSFDKKYIFGIDPASEQDKFAITVLEQHPEHRRIVYVWTSNKKDFQTDRADGFITNTNDFYTYCIFKIRDLMRRFPCERIIIDSQGGGHMIVEGLKSNELLKDGEVPLLPVIVPGKPSITDGEPGLHIIELASFSDNTWISNANHGLKKDLENKVLLFPFVDAVSLEIASIQDNSNNRLIDTQEDNVFEIEELKNELSSIVHSSTPTGKERWDTPDTKLPGNKQKGRMRKDRYSSLLIANMCARTIANTPVYIINQESGGFAGASNQTKGLKYTGSSWLANKLNDLYQD